ncbi:FAD-dependent monooxygenase [Fodinicola acaciae]|uniref:FAD-dependent monooxygenase n=1 Tax=Fodinicola acaciae TaxID=2681555 RepID=UPI0013D8BE7A|nr:FAD-dependent monooxygenase [Fodinicola acaciae]
MATAVVAGAGIGGLTAASALVSRGWDVTICEQAPELAPVGTAIALTANALHALDAIGLGDDVRALGVPEATGGLRTADGRYLVRVDDRSGVLVLHRSALIDVLRPKDADLRLGTTVEGVTMTAGGPGRLVTSRGEITADLIVAADGARSMLRTLLFPGHPGLRYADYTAMRLTAPYDTAGMAASESWGPGARFGVVPMSPDEVYAYAAFNMPAGSAYDDPRGELKRRFGDWHDPIPQLIEVADNVLQHDVYDLARPLPAYHAGPVAFVGDAAHAMTPDLGQGGCQAIEDGVVLARTVTGADVRGRLPAYTGARLKRTVSIMRQSRQMARLGQVSSPLAVIARTGAMRLVGILPASVTDRALVSLHNWRP